MSEHLSVLAAARHAYAGYNELRAAAFDRAVAEPDWEYGIGWSYGDSTQLGTAMPDRQSAEDLIAQYPDDPDFGPNYLVRRVPERRPGAWMPVTAEGAQRS